MNPIENVNSKRVLLIAAGVVMLGIAAVAVAFDFPWKPDYEANYQAAVEQSNAAEQSMLLAFENEARARADLAFDKAKDAVDAQDTGELARLTNVAESLRNQIATLQEKRENLYVLVCEDVAGEQVCFPRAW